MRDSNDVMEDSLSEDTMMECGNDGEDFDNLVDLATNITNSAPTIRDAAEKLLTLLEVDEDDADSLSQSSEDEGVEADMADSDEELDEPKNSKLLHQLAASLAQELRYSRKHNPPICRTSQHQNHSSDLVQSMEVYQESTYNVQSREDMTISLSDSAEQPDNAFSASCLSRLSPAKKHKRLDSGTVWTAGWDACAAEALRYLVEIEGLPAYHPTVLAMKNHLEAQRERFFAQFTT